MKLKCNKCGKKQAELMSKMDIQSSSNFTDVSTNIFNKILNIVDNLYSPNYIVCKACGYVEKA